MACTKQKVAARLTLIITQKKKDLLRAQADYVENVISKKDTENMPG